MKDIFSESKPMSDDPKDYEDRVAIIPEYQPDVDPREEYKDFPEERVWSPIEEGGESWMPLFMFMARSVITCAQEQLGIENAEAMENSSNGLAEQYISNVLHDSGCVPEVALRTLLTKELPKKLYARWTHMEMMLFEKGLNRYGKNFTAIKMDFLPQKTTMDLVEFYYTWKRSKQAKGKVASRPRRLLRRRSKPSNLIIGSPTAEGVLTRSQLAAVERSEKPAEKMSNEMTTVYTGIKRKRRVTRQTRAPLITV